MKIQPIAARTVGEILVDVATSLGYWFQPGKVGVTSPGGTSPLGVS